ncbi:MAG: hypothetical protein OXN97_03440 [Bryobacterales bacterium]|nr:hypothetical protein [Bryobacterales bacterium]MDE0625027.1 hypothetical protein [Bryobacterales bacterium]
MTRRVFTTALAGGAMLRAETRQEKAERLVREALEGIGGQKFLEIQTQVRSGRAYSFYNRQVRGMARITIYDRFDRVDPDAGDDWLPLRRREVYTEKGDYYALFLNGEGYEVTYRGAVPQPEDYMQRYRLASRRDIFYFLRYRMDEPGLYYYYNGIEIVDNVPCHSLDIVDAEGEAITLFVRQSDGLPVQQLYLRRDPKTRIPYQEKSVFGRYRPAGEALLPWIIRRERDDERVFELYAQSFEVNRPLKAAVFALPDGLPLLPPNP